MGESVNFLTKLWFNYNTASSLLTDALQSSTNEVGEFAERLVAEFYHAKKLKTSNKSADLQTIDNKLIQVKSRKINKLKTTSLGVIRSWDFDLLVIVLFDKNGRLIKALEIGALDAKQLSKRNEHQNGDIISTNEQLLNHQNAKDITNELEALLIGENQKKLNDLDFDKMVVNTRKSVMNITASTFTIEFVPKDEKLFKEQLLRFKKAKRTWFFPNNKVETDTWDASKFRPDSNLRGNITSNNKVKDKKNTGLYKIKLEILEK